MGLAAAALAAVIMLPNPLLGAGAMIGLLVLDLALYWGAHNKFDRVPASQKWNLNLADMKTRREERASAKQAAGSKLVLAGPAGAVPVPDKETPEFALRIAVEEMLLDAVDKRVSDMEIVPAKDGVYARVLTVDGVASKPEAVRAEEAIAAIDLLKAAADLDLDDRRRKLTGEFKIGMGESHQTVRLQTSGGSSGVRARILFNPGARVRSSSTTLVSCRRSATRSKHC